MTSILTTRRTLLTALFINMNLELLTNVGAMIPKITIYFKDTDLVPDDAYKIELIYNISTLEECLLLCSKKDACQTILYEGSTCTMYSTCDGIYRKSSDQRVVTIYSTDTTDLCVKMMPCLNGATCSPTTTFPYYKCQCQPLNRGKKCDQFLQIPALFASETNITLQNGDTKQGLVEDGWVVLLRRKDGSVSFTSKSWDDYKNGFGQLKGEFWLGNELVHLLTTNASYRVRFDLVSHDGQWVYAEYSHFSVGPENDSYRLHIGGYSGNASDGMTGHGSNQTANNMPFYRPDDHFCSTGGWWLNQFCYVRLTGTYDLTKDSWLNIVWYPFSKRLAYADMKITII